MFVVHTCFVIARIRQSILDVLSPHPVAATARKSLLPHGSASSELLAPPRRNAKRERLMPLPLRSFLTIDQMLSSRRC